MSNKGSGVRGRVKMRTRPIDITKPLQLIDTSESNEGLNDQPMIEITGQTNINTNQSSGAIRAPIINTTSSTDNITIGSKSRVEIPIPPVNKNVNFYNKMKYSTYHIPNYYIKSHIFTSAAIAPTIELYDLQQEDIEWLQKHNTPSNNNSSNSDNITEAELSACIDLYEKEAGRLTTRNESYSIDEKEVPESIFTYNTATSIASYRLNLPTQKSGDIYTYWIGKRRRLGKALLSYYQEPPPRGNTSPHVAFRPRVEPRRQSKRSAKKEDYTTPFIKLQQLRNDMQRVLTIGNHLAQREQIKLDLQLTNTHLFDIQLNNIHICKLINEISCSDKDKRNTIQIKKLSQLLHTTLPQPTLHTPIINKTQSSKSNKKSSVKSKGLSHSVSKDVLQSRSTTIHKQQPLPSSQSINKPIRPLSNNIIQPLHQPELKVHDMILSDEDSDEDEDDTSFYNTLEQYLINKIRHDDKIFTQEEIQQQIQKHDTATDQSVYPPNNINGVLRARIGRNGRFIIDHIDYTVMKQRIATAHKLHRPIHYIPYDYHIDNYYDDIDAFGINVSTGYINYTYSDLGLPPVLHESDLIDLPIDNIKLDDIEIDDDYVNMRVDKLPLLPESQVFPKTTAADNNNVVKDEVIDNNDTHDIPMITV